MIDTILLSSASDLSLPLMCGDSSSVFHVKYKLDLLLQSVGFLKPLVRDIFWGYCVYMCVCIDCVLKCHSVL